MGCADLKKHIIEHEILGIGASSGGGGASLTIIDGYPTYVDDSRGGKILSTSRLSFTATRRSKAEDIYLRSGEGIPTGQTGFRMIHAGTITAAALQLSDLATCTLHIYRNDLLIPIVVLPVVGSEGAHLNGLNADFQESDILQLYLDGLGNNPVAWIEVAWRF
jgi:hypothetical protein